jgi:hypothetical protein
MNDTARRLAEDEIVCACDALSAPEALAAMTEVQAQILADHAIVPGTPAFEAFLEMYVRTLPGRVRALHREATGSTH